MSTKIYFNRHHRRPRSRRGNGKPKNISIVNAEEHTAYHRLFGNMLPHEMAKMLNDTWIDADYIFVVQLRKEKS